MAACNNKPKYLSILNMEDSFFCAWITSWGILFQGGITWGVKTVFLL